MAATAGILAFAFVAFGDTIVEERFLLIPPSILRVSLCLLEVLR